MDKLLIFKIIFSIVIVILGIIAIVQICKGIDELYRPVYMWLEVYKPKKKKEEKNDYSRNDR